MFAVEDRLGQNERWREERATVIASGARPSVRIQTATAWAAEAAKLGIDAAILDLPMKLALAISLIQIPGAEASPRSLVRDARARRPRDSSTRRCGRGHRAHREHSPAS